MSILGTKKDYTRYYGDFRGVDFSSDHTQVHNKRLAYLVNMYKDYQSGQGYALETVPGFRRRFEIENVNAPIYGIHEFKVSEDSLHLLVHIGDKLYLWETYKETATLEKEISNGEGDTKCFKINLSKSNVSKVIKVEKADGELSSDCYTLGGNSLTVSENSLNKGDTLDITYEMQPALLNTNITMNEMRSVSFIMDNTLFILDGSNYLYYDGNALGKVSERADCYIPTTYINIIPSGENADGGTEYEQRNLLSPYFKNTFIPDGKNGVFKIKEEMLNEDCIEVKVYGAVKNKNEHYTVNFLDGTVTFMEGHIPPIKATLADKAKEKDENSTVNNSSNAEDIKNADNYPEEYAGVEITAKKARDASFITNCTIAATFDNRVFLSGNPALPNRVFWSAADDPLYFPENCFVNDGVGMAPITGMLAVADTLMVLKSDTQQDGAVYFHTAEATKDDLYPKIYPSTRGLAGIGCFGACINFLDDPVFVSRLGVEAVGQLSTRLERAIEHRSSLIDAKLLNLGVDKLSRASFTEWNGYLVLLVDGKIFLADSRQRYNHNIGVMQYEWYYLEDIGVWDEQYPAYHYAKYIDGEITVTHDGKEYTVILAPEAMRGALANAPNERGEKTVEVYGSDGDIHYVLVDGKAYLCDSYGEYIGGKFKPACVVQSIGDNLFFGTENGVICSFNFDKHNEYGEIPATWYSFDGRTIFSGCATKMDNCDIPHLTKSTVKKSTVIKTRSMQLSAAKVQVRTNLKPYEQIARINSTVFSFEDMDFDDFSFITLDQSLFAVKEKEKKWVEKQYYIFSDEFMRPFSLYYVTYRYCVAGRYKE